MNFIRSCLTLLCSSQAVASFSHVWKIRRFPGWGSNRSCSCQPTPQPQPQPQQLGIRILCSLRQCRILNPRSGARDQTRILMDTNRVHNPQSRSGNSQDTHGFAKSLRRPATCSGPLVPAHRPLTPTSPPSLSLSHTHTHTRTHARTHARTQAALHTPTPPHRQLTPSPFPIHLFSSQESSRTSV